MKSSSAEAHPDPTAPSAASAAGTAPGGSPTAELWRRRGRNAPAIASAAALLGVDIVTLGDAVAISLAASPEAALLLDGMELRVRTLKTTVATSEERCVYSVRGPVLWSETITARANALGNEDVFVCMTASRSFDTVENRILVAALEAIGRAERALRGPTGERVDPAEVGRIAAVAAEANRWREHPRLADIRSARLNGRELARLRGGHRMTRLAPVLAIRQRVAEPFVPEDVDGLADAVTRRYHGFVLEVLTALAPRRPLACSDGGLWCGGLSFRHPATVGGGTEPGLWLRGRPLLPPRGMVDEAPWAEKLPAHGTRLENRQDLLGLVEALRAGAQPRSHSSSGSGSRSSSSS